MTAVIIIVICVLVGLAGFFGGVTIKRSKNSKMCEGSYYCTIFGPGRIWHKVMHADGGIIVKPDEKDKKFYEKNEPPIPFPLEGFIIPINANVPNTMWPVEASKKTQVPIPELIYHVGSSMPLGFNVKGEFVGYIDEKSGVSPAALAALFKNKDTVQLFRQMATENSNAPETKQKINIWNIILLIGVAATIIIGIMTYLAVSGGIGDLKNGFGF
jgi:hypothetical protein